MRYWVYINDKVEGPYEEDALVSVAGFTPNTLICSEEVASKGGQEWIKASDIFEFDEVPLDPAPAAPQPTVTVQEVPASDAIDTQALLAKLEFLNKEVSNLQSKLDSMQTHFDQALEQTQHAQEHAQEKPAQEAPQPTAQAEEPPVSYQPQADPNEEELIIRSAMDSMYGAKLLNEQQGQTQEEKLAAQENPDDTFHDLVTGETAADFERKNEEKKIHELEENLDLVPVEETPAQPTQEQAQEPQPAPAQELPPAEQPAAQQAPTQDPSVDDIMKDLEFIPVDEPAPAEQPAPEQAQPAAVEESLPVEEPLPQEPALQEEPAIVEEELVQEAQEAPEESAPVAQALITTPSLEEAQRDELINQLTNSAQEDILDQIIAEHQQAEQPSQEEAQPQTQEPQQDSSSAMLLGAAGLAAAASAVVAFHSKDEQPAENQEVPAQEPSDQIPAQEEPFSLNVDRENPSLLEEVMPADQMPPDVETPEVSQEQEAPIPQLDLAPEVTPQEKQALDLSQSEDEPHLSLAEDLPQDAPATQEAQPAQEALTLDALPADQPQESAEPEISAGPAPEKMEEIPSEENPAPEQEEPAQEVEQAEQMMQEPPEEPAQEAQEGQEEQEPAALPETDSQDLPQEEKSSKLGEITEKDLQDAFGTPDENEQPSFPAAAASNWEAQALYAAAQSSGNPNELTEIELKEGSTYLISDFVPPDQVGPLDDQSEDAKAQTAFQDILATATANQQAKPLNTDGLPEDFAATQINLENTIQAKRGASLDIKTVPMVPEPGADRVNINDLNDVNAQHEMKSGGKASKLTKWVIGLLLTLLLLLIFYVALGLMHLLPATLNVFAPKADVSTQAAQELLADQQPAAAEQPAAPDLSQEALEKVKQFPLPNGYQLQGFILSKHPAIEPALITWEASEAVEPDNYSITVKVPPENPQSYKTVYRFNYNMNTGLLEPTISNAKNLLDQAYSNQTAAQEVQAPAEETTTPAPAARSNRRRR